MKALTRQRLFFWGFFLFLQGGDARAKEVAYGDMYRGLTERPENKASVVDILRGGGTPRSTSAVFWACQVRGQGLINPAHGFNSRQVQCGFYPPERLPRKARFAPAFNMDRIQSDRSMPTAFAALP